MKNNFFLIGIGLIMGLSSCSKEDINPERINYSIDFNRAGGIENWQSFFSDYNVSNEENLNLIFEYTNLPEPLNTNLKSIKVSGKNSSDDLLSAIFRKFDGLHANSIYSVTFDIDFASKAPTNAVGVGGSPDLAIGAGGINFPPENSIDDINHFKPNFVSALQRGDSNEVFQVLGNIGVSDNINTPFKLISRNNLKSPIKLMTNSEGEIWLMIAIDSGFESTTTLYYKSIKISLVPE